jgi:hypothetical protein
MLELAPTQWAGRMTGQWAVSAGALVAYTPPTPVLTLAQQAAEAVQAGLTLTLSGTIALAATVFPIDPTTQSKLAAVATIINTTGGFPGGAATYPMKDGAGGWHTFDLAQYKAVAASLAAYAASLDLIIDGNPLGATALPGNSVALTV